MSRKESNVHIAQKQHWNVKPEKKYSTNIYIYIYIFNHLIIPAMKAIFMQNTSISQNFLAPIQCIYLVTSIQFFS